MYKTYIILHKRRKSAVLCRSVYLNVIILETQLVVYQMCIFHGMLSFALNFTFFSVAVVVVVVATGMLY